MNGIMLNNEMMLHIYKFLRKSCNHICGYIHSGNYVNLGFSALDKNHWCCFFGSFGDGSYDILLHDLYVINKFKPNDAFFFVCNDFVNDIIVIFNSRK